MSRNAPTSPISQHSQHAIMYRHTIRHPFARASSQSKVQLFLRALAASRAADIRGRAQSHTVPGSGSHAAVPAAKRARFDDARDGAGHQAAATGAIDDRAPHREPNAHTVGM